MSKALNNAAAIKTRLQTAPTGSERTVPVNITGIDVIVDRQTNIGDAIGKAMAGAAGVGITILWTGFINADEKSSDPRLANRYQITCWSREILTKGALPVDDVMEAVILRLHHWKPNSGDPYFNEAIVRNGDILEGTHAGVDAIGYTCEVILPVSL
jgi:hypothetical protein